jgi:hypothetical protein
MDEVAPPPKKGLWQRWQALRQRLKDHFAEYGAIALVVWVALFGLTFAGFWIAISSGAQVEGAAGETGSIGAAYVATQLTKPLRILATIAVTPFVAEIWLRVRGRKAKPEPEPPKPES